MSYKLTQVVPSASEAALALGKIVRCALAPALPHENWSFVTYVFCPFGGSEDVEEEAYGLGDCRKAAAGGMTEWAGQADRRRALRNCRHRGDQLSLAARVRGPEERPGASAEGTGS